MELVKGYQRDPHSRVLINNDEKQYKDHQWKMDVAIKMKKMQSDIDMLKQVVAHLEARLEEKS